MDEESAMTRDTLERLKKMSADEKQVRFDELNAAIGALRKRRLVFPADVHKHEPIPYHPRSQSQLRRKRQPAHRQFEHLRLGPQLGKHANSHSLRVRDSGSPL